MNKSSTVASPVGESLNRSQTGGDAAQARVQGLTEEMHRLTRQLKASNRELHHHLAEKARMQSLLFSTLQSLTVGVLAIGRDGVIIAANTAACRIFERPIDRLATCQLRDVLQGIPKAGELIRTLLGEGLEEARIAWRPECQAGDGFHIELIARKAAQPHDLHLAGVVLAEDQTELRRLEQQANLRSRLTGMGSIAMNMAHEIRNPLGSIALIATTLEKVLADDESLGPLARQIVQGVKSLDHIVVNSLEFAKPRRMILSRVNLAELLRDTLAYVEHPLGQKGLRLRMSDALPAEACVAGDREQLRQVMLNVYLNAIQAMGEGGELSIRLARQGRERWQVAVADTGGGIPLGIMDRIFDPFFTTREKGTGIGMAVVQRILLAHNATIDIQSEVGKGTTVLMTFPEHQVFEHNQPKQEG